jgi:alpha-tubulin suppressor-like RCC1 family protein
VASAYSYLTNSGGQPIVWSPGTVPLQIKVDNTIAQSDGTTLATSIQAAAQAWNAQITTVQFSTSLPGEGSGAPQNGVNELFFTSTPYGTSWESNTLAVTVTWYDDTTGLSSESDVLFNSAYTWGSYRGVLQGNPVDVRRVALHELGHVLGLDHPDEHGQSWAAIMNSTISDIDSLQVDDIQGAQSLYGVPGGTIAPTITSQPQPQSIYIGFTTTFSVTASGTAPLAYHWQVYLSAFSGWAPLSDDIFYSGTTTSTLSILGANAVYGANSHLDGNIYRCVVTNSVGSATSNGALLRVTAAPPVILFQPVDQTVFVTQTAQFTILADAYGPVSYLWQRLPFGSSTWQDLSDGGNYSSTHDRFLYVVITVGMNGDQFRCVVTNPGGSITSNAALLTVDPGVAPAITLNPQSQSVAEGDSVTFTASASGVPSPALQWQKDNVDIPGATGTFFTISRVAADDAGSYRLVATNVAGTATSNAAILNVGGPLITSLSPSRVVVTAGQTLSLSVTATGTGSISYQWLRNGRPVSGATTPNLNVSNVAWPDRGWYRVLLTDSTGTRGSAPIFVIVSTLTRVRAWGTEDYPTLKVVPAGLNDAVSVAAGMWHALALKADGHVVAWGPGNEGQVNVPAGLNNAVAIATGYRNSFVLKSDGTVVSFGLHDSSDVITVPAGLNKVVAISAGGMHAIALKSDGTVVCWGDNSFGVSTVPTGLTGVVAIAAGDYHSLALKSDGTVVQWGASDPPPAGLSNVTAIAGGWSHSLALKSDGTLVAWGYSGYGLDSPPVAPSGYQAMVTGNSLSFGLTNAGTVNAWGFSGPSTYLLVPPADLDHVVTIGAGVYYVALAIVDAHLDTAPIISAQPTNQNAGEGQTATFSVTASGGTAALSYQWRRNNVNISGANSSTLILSNVTPGQAGSYDVVVTDYLGSVTSTAATLSINALPVVTLSGPARNVLVPGQSLSLTVTATGTGPLSYQWIHNGRLVSGATSNVFTISTTTRQDSGWYLALVTDNYGLSRSEPMFVAVETLTTAVRGWGDNDWGETSIPSGLAGVLQVSAGKNYSALALKRDGTVASWGYSYAFQLQVPAGLSSVVAVSAGYSHAAVLKSDGTVVTWGGGGYGLLPVPGSVTHVVAIAAGGGFTVALKRDGTVVSWDATGVLLTNVPAGLTHVIAITAGDHHAVALKDDGTIATWTNYDVGQMNVPAGLSGVVAVAAGGEHSLVLKNDGTVVAWGNSGLGAETVPAGLTNVVSISGGHIHSLALKNDGTVVGWGYNRFGETAAPNGLVNIHDVSGGSMYSLALYDTAVDTVPQFTTQPTGQRAQTGGTATITVAASGAPPPTFQWQRLPVGSGTWSDLSNGGNYSGVTTGGLTISGTTAGMNGDQFRCVATNSVGTATTNAATLTVYFAPSVTLQPLSQRVRVGATVTFTVGASGSPALTYQWRKNGVNIPGATGSTLTLTNVHMTDDGTYTVIVTNSLNFAISDGALLTVSLIPGDFDGDGKSDIVLTNTVTGDRAIWLMNGATIKTGLVIGNLPTDWVISGTGDFDGDGKADIVLTNTATGDRAIWIMNGATITTGLVIGNLSTDWVISGTGDFDGDGKSDIVLTNTVTGNRAVWIMNGAAITTGLVIGTLPTDWVISGIGDFDGDGKADIVLSNTVTGNRAVWIMNGATITTGLVIGTLSTDWVISGTGDFNGDGKSDIVLSNTVTGNRAVWIMNGATITTGLVIGTLPTDWVISNMGDYDGDGKADIVLSNTVTGNRAVWIMNGATITTGLVIGTLPADWVINR